MRTAEEAGIAPALHHADPTAGVAIMDFVPGRSLSDYPGGPGRLARDLGGLAARLHATPAFPPVADYLTVLERLLGRLLGSGLFAAGLLDRHQEGFQRIRQAYPWDSGALVSSHNDPIPAISCSMASGCGSSTGRRRTATTPSSMWQSSPSI